jgi:uracil-DNA glycosylase
MFYEVLKKYGFENAHITDLVKTRGKVISRMSKDEIELNWLIFNKELKLLNPKLLVSVGNDVYNTLKDRISNIRVDKITHYAYRWKSQSTVKAKLEADLGRIRQIIGR